MSQSADLPVSDRTRTLRLSQTDLIRFIVITTITLSIAGITYLSTAAGVRCHRPPALFYFPILYATYFYPARGIYVAGCSAVAYLVIALPFALPGPVPRGRDLLPGPPLRLHRRRVRVSPEKPDGAPVHRTGKDAA